MTHWADLSDDELAARLFQRGAEYAVAHDLVATRDDPWAAAKISDILGPP